ncbi:unnamed protein product [Blepharisma stoltei]|uniref:Transmembrane protein n=1 Tax=Blepharisma stoltei TaxID=1481888 RepID=A0AAU9JY64_9CILI|nr:unnamed protein product [Blepharisma stoltei]
MLLSNFAFALAFLIDFWYWNVCLFRKRNEKIPYICIIMLLLSYAAIEYTKALENIFSFEFVSLTIKEYFINLPLDWQSFIQMVQQSHYVNIPNLIFFNAIVLVYQSTSLVLICILAMINNYYFLTIEYASYGWIYYFLFLMTIFLYIYFNHKAWRKYSGLWLLIKCIHTILLIFDFANFVSQLCGYNLKIADLALWMFLKISGLIVQVLILLFY